MRTDFGERYAAAALLFQTVLVIHFAMRRWQFEVAMRYGWIVYALGVPMAGLSVFLLLSGAPWWMWTRALFVAATILNRGSHRGRGSAQPAGT